MMTNAKLKVTFTDIEVTRDGDPLDRGELYWSFKVDGSEVASRSSSNPLTIGSGGTISLGQSATVTKSGAVGTNLVISGSVSDKDGGKDESAPFSISYNQGDNWGTNNPHTAHLVDNNLDVTLNYIIERV
jgi:hypothetical protein